MRRLAWLFAVALLGVLMAGGLPMGGGHPTAGAGAPARGEFTPSSTTPASNAAGSGPPSWTVADTLVLFNNTLVAGNDLAQDGLRPEGLAYDASKSEVFVADAESGTVSVISTTSDRVVASIPGITGPDDVAYDPAHGEIFVTGANGLSVINDSTNSVVASLVGPDATALGYDPGIGAIFVAGEFSSYVGVYNDTNVSLEATLTVGAWAWAFAYDPAKGEMFVATSTSTYSNPPATGAVSVVANTNLSVVTSVGVGEWPLALAYDSARGEVFTANYYTQNVSVVNDTTVQVVATVPIGEAGQYILADPGLSEVFVGGGTVRVINDTSDMVTANISLSSPPGEIALDPGLGQLWLSQWSNDSLAVVNAANRTVAGAVSVGGLYPDALAFDSGTDQIFVADVFSNNLTVVSGASYRVIRDVPVGIEPDGIAYDPEKGEIFVANANCPGGYPICLGSGTVSVISDTNDTVVATILVGWNPLGVTYDAARGEVFVGCFGNQVDVINDTSDQVVAQVGVSGADGVAYDPARGYVYAASSNGSEVAVINDTTNTAFTNISYAGWPVAVMYDAARSEVFVGGSEYPSGAIAVVNDTRNVIVANVTTGVDDYALATDGQGTVFAAAGEASNNLSVISDQTNTVTENITVGGDPEAIAVDPQSDRVFVANEANGSLSILSLAPSPTTYNVTVTETGLPAGTSWSGRIGGVTEYSTTSSLTFQEPNGTYAYTVEPVAGYFASYLGVVQVYGAPVTENVTFLPTFAVWFNETGLPLGTNWSVTLNNSLAPYQTLASTGSSIRFQLPNGSGDYGIAAIPGYTTDPWTGGYRVQGLALTIAVAWSEVVYSVVFNETGLPGVTASPVGPFSVTLNGTDEEGSSDSSAVFSEPNGSYPFVVTPPSGWTASPQAGTVLVQGQAVVRTLNFSVVIPPLTVSFTFQVQTGCGGPFNVTFTSTVTGGTPPYTYSWNFGDGSLGSSQADPTHEYSGASTSPTVTLTVHDSDGLTASSSVELQVIYPACAIHEPTSASPSYVPLALAILAIAVLVASVAVLVVFVYRKRHP